MAGALGVAAEVSAHFQTPLRMENIDGLHVKLLEPLIYWTEVERIGKIIVPVGFETDYASVPRGLWNLFPPNGKYAPGAVVHDYLYRRTLLDRKVCDQILMEAMQVLGVSWLTRHLIYRAVRLFGGAARKQEESHVLVESLTRLVGKARRRGGERGDRTDRHGAGQ